MFRPPNISCLLSMIRDNLYPIHRTIGCRAISSINQASDSNVHCSSTNCNLMWYSCGELSCGFYGFGVWWCTSIGGSSCNGLDNGICYHDCFLN